MYKSVLCRMFLIVKSAAEKNGAGEGAGSTKTRQESPFAIGSQKQAVLSAGHQSKRVFRKC